MAILHLNALEVIVTLAANIFEPYPQYDYVMWRPEGWHWCFNMTTRCHIFLHFFSKARSFCCWHYEMLNFIFIWNIFPFFCNEEILYKKMTWNDPFSRTFELRRTSVSYSLNVTNISTYLDTFTWEKSEMRMEYVTINQAIKPFILLEMFWWKRNFNKSVFKWEFYWRRQSVIS